MSPRISGPPTHAPFHHGIREGPAAPSSERGDTRSETGAETGAAVDRAGHLAPPAVSAGAPVVIMRSEDGGIELLAEDRTYVLGIEAMRHLLFFGNRVRLDGGDAVAWPGADRRWICFVLDGGMHVISRYRLVAVARGSVPADWLSRLEAR
jgi:hypothetical protein